MLSQIHFRKPFAVIFQKKRLEKVKNFILNPYILGNFAYNIE